MSSPNRTPFQDITNTSTRTDANATNGDNLRKKPPSRNGWYARMTPEKKAEYLEKLREKRQQKKAAKVSENSTTCQASGQGWYARMTEEEKAEYLEKLRISRQKKKMAAVSGCSENVEMPRQSSQRVSPGVMQMGSGQSCITQQRRSPNALGSQKHKENDDITWLHRNDTYQRTTGKENYTPNVIATASSMRNHISRLDATETQTSSWSQMSAEQSFVEPDESTASEKKRQRSREHYSNMPAEKRGIVLQRNRDNKKGKFIAETSSPSQIMNMSSATIIGPSPSTPDMQSRSENNSSGISNMENRLGSSYNQLRQSIISSTTLTPQQKTTSLQMLRIARDEKMAGDHIGVNSVEESHISLTSVPTNGVSRFTIDHKQKGVCSVEGSQRSATNVTGIFEPTEHYAASEGDEDSDTTCIFQLDEQDSLFDDDDESRMYRGQAL